MEKRERELAESMADFLEWDEWAKGADEDGNFPQSQVDYFFKEPKAFFEVWDMLESTNMMMANETILEMYANIYLRGYDRFTALYLAVDRRKK